MITEICAGMSLRAKAVRAYRRGGVSEVARGGIVLVTRTARRAFDRKVKRRIIANRWLGLPYYVRKHTREAQEAAQELSSIVDGPKLTEVDFSEYKSSDTLFVLASGGSIAQITDAQWEHIDQCDSVGLNRWPVHDFVPTYLVFELKFAPKYREFRNEYWQLLEHKQTQYSDVPMILKPSYIVRNFEPGDLPEWLEGEIIASCDSGFERVVGRNGFHRNEKLLQYLYDHGYFDRLEVLYRKRGSVSQLLHFGVGLGYENIVLCGVDMVDSKYFFDERSEYYERQNVPIPKYTEPSNDSTETANTDSEDGAVDSTADGDETDSEEDDRHPTFNPEFGNLTLDRVIYSMRDIVLDPEGVDLYVENTKSALHPTVPEYEYPKEIKDV